MVVHINPTEIEVQVPQGSLLLQVIQKTDKKLAREALAVKVDDHLVDLVAPLPDHRMFAVFTFEDPEGKQVYRHSTAHILAQAVKRLYPGAKLAIGPAIADGFYYDFDVPKSFTPEDFIAIETEMRKIIKENHPFIREEVSRAEALALFAEQGETYKVELIENLPEEATISLYRQGEFVDLCAGPHVPSTGYIKAIKLLNLAGAYWRGDERNKMLQRLYGTAYPRQAQLDDYLRYLEEARKRDHRKLGLQLDLYSFTEEGPGFPFFHPKGMIIRNELETFWRTEHRKRNYQEIKTPLILSRTLWEQSGHWDHYQENMYFTKIDEKDYAIKPMNCPGSILIYKNHQHSYRELPVRLAELGLVHRHELSGVLHGLMRVRCFTQDDAHIFMRADQITDEVVNVIDFVDDFYRIFDFSYTVELSTRPEKAMGSDAIWEQATNALVAALETRKLGYKVNEGDGAFYGPKIDFHLMDCLGRTWQCGTVQLDFLMPEKFGLTYIGEDGQKHQPVMIHRVIFGSLERFIAILTEHYAGAFPVWLAPVQVRIIPIADRHHGYALSVKDQFDPDIRVEVDLRNEKIGYKIREAQLEKVPYMIIVGDKEMAEGNIAVRQRGAGDQGVMPVDQFMGRLSAEIAEKA
jgi:threonyl-tRNA synthetase